MNFFNDHRINDLRKTIFDSLHSHIDNDYVLLDVPNHRNIGDLLIWEGELEFLKNTSHKLTYSSNIFTHRDNRIKENDVILLHGGGNFGDVWRLNQEFRNKIVRRFPHNKIIVLPQTLHYSDEKNIKKDIEVYNNHPNLILCTRDNVSYEFAKYHFNCCNVLLVPDMAFCLDFRNYHTQQNESRSLILKRMDKELGNTSGITNIESKLIKAKIPFDVEDWPGFYPYGTVRRRIQQYAIKAERVLSDKLLKTPILKKIVDDEFGLNPRTYRNDLIKKGISFINRYDTVYSTRLHGFILSVLLNKKVFIFDNSYGKNKNFFDTWLGSFENVQLI